MKKGFLKKLLAFTLAAVMTVPSMLVPVQAAETEAPLAPKYQFEFEENLKESAGTITAEAKAQQMGTYSGTVSYGEARDGEGKAVNLGSYGLDLNIPDKITEYTLSLWAKPVFDFAENQQVFFIGTNNPGEDWIGLGGSEHGGLKLWTLEKIGNTIGSHTIAVDNVEYATGEWQQYILSIKDGQASIFVNGERFGSGKLSATALTRETSDVFLGINYWADPVFNGLMDDVKFYDVAVTEEQAAALYQAEKMPEEEKPEGPVYDEIVLLDFTFDDQETGFKGGQAVAAPAGTIVTDGDRTALQLNGSSSNWLNVTKEDGSSLLAGITKVDGFEELVISYDIKTNRSDWSLFIAPNTNEQTYQSEKYIGAFINDSGNFMVERYYSNNEARPGFTGRAIARNAWAHVEIRLTEDTTTFSIDNGNPVTQGDRVSLERILGSNPILQIGKANWGNGEYFNGSLDNYKIVMLQKPIPEVGSINKDALKAAVAAEKEAALVKDSYTESSWAAYEKAIADAEALLPDDARTYQAEVDEAVEAIASAKASLQKYTAELEAGYYLTVYSTTTRFYASASNVDQETRSVYMAVSSDGKNFDVLNNNGGVIFSKSPNGTLEIKEPQVFKTEDGTFTVVAPDYNESRGYHVFTSTDGVHYYDDTVVPERPLVGDPLKEDNFTLMFDGKNLLETDANITLGNAVALTEAEYTYIVNKLGTVKNNGLAELEDVKVEANGELTEEMLPETVTATYTDGSSKEFPVDWTGALEDVDLTKEGTYEITGTVVQTKYLNKLKELNGSALPEDDPENENTDFPSNYDPSTRTVYYDETKFIEGMADPNIFWDEQTGYYYMTGSYFPEDGDKIDANDNTQQYDRVVLRKAKTLEGLQDRSQQVTIWKAGNQGYINNNGQEVARGYRYIWAPEIHRVGDYWVVYFTESQSSNNVYGIYSHALVLDGDMDPYETALTASNEASQWQDYQMDTSVSGGINSIGTSFCLDMTYFKDEVNGTDYVVWAGKPTVSYGGSSTDLFIATVDPEQPWMLTSQQHRLTCSDYGWERIRYCVNEGATVLQHDGNVFMAYSVSGTGSEYAIGMLSAKAGEDLLDINNWIKSPYPVLTSRDVDGEEGPGHNSFTVDQDGNVIFVYHARPTTHNYQMCGWDGNRSSYNGDPLSDPCRHARLKRVHWAADGTPILKMTYDNELLEENQTVTLKVVVGEGGSETPDKGENIALTAVASGSYVSSWMSKQYAGINDGVDTIPEGENGNDYAWATWGNTTASEYVQYNWDVAVEITGSDLYVWDDNPNDLYTGVDTPASFVFEYLPAGSDEWVEIKTVTEGIVGGASGELNSVTFDEAVTATALRVTLNKNLQEGATEAQEGVGLTEWKVYGTLGEPVVVPVDKAELESAIADAVPAEDADKYTEESWADYAAALANAEKVFADEDATQSEVDAAIMALENAEASLKEKVVIEFPFVDVTEEDWFYGSVYYNFVEKLMTGLDATHFGPYGELSRAQFALILYRIEGLPEVETEKTFKDIVGDEWYGQAVLWAAEAGIVTGYLDGNFGPTDNITREQMAVMMYRYAKYLEEDVTKVADISAFADAESVSEFAEDAFAWANGMGIITGKENGTLLAPQANTARAEAAAIIERFVKAYEG